MSPQKTVFIIGAGASNEVGLPIGSDLKGKIISALNPNPSSENNLIKQSLSRNTDAYRAFRDICSGLPLASSIDNYLDVHNDDSTIVLCGKLAIVRTILQAERHSDLFISENGQRKLNTDSLKDTWFALFFHKLCENCLFSDLDARLKTIAFVVFNYDRCLEHFLYHAIQQYYRVDATEVSALLVKSLNIWHPYGTVGSLPWLTNSDNQIDYGATPNAPQLRDLV